MVPMISIIGTVIICILWAIEFVIFYMGEWKHLAFHIPMLMGLTMAVIICYVKIKKIREDEKNRLRRPVKTIVEVKTCPEYWTEYKDPNTKDVLCRSNTAARSQGSASIEFIGSNKQVAGNSKLVRQDGVNPIIVNRTEWNKDPNTNDKCKAVLDDAGIAWVEMSNACPPRM